MKPGSLLVFLAVLSLSGVAIQIGSTVLDPIKNDSPAAYYLLGGICLIAAIATAGFATKAWNQKMGK